MVDVRSIGTGVLALMVSACSTSSFVRTADPDTVTFVGTQAESRVAITSVVGPYSRPGLVDPSYITCTEPSPDVAKAVGRAFEAAVAVPTKGSLELSSSLATGLAQLAERTASIQLLREKMYQNCLAYKNGAISGVTYTLIMSRLDDAIVTLMLGETAGGAFGRSGAAITTSAQASGSSSVPTLTAGLDGIDEAAKKIETARAAIEAKTLERDKAQGSCNEELAKQATIAEAERKKPADIKECATAQELTQVINVAQGELKATMDLLRGQISATARTAAKAEGASGVGGLTHKPDAAIARVLAEMQDNFLTYDVSSTVIPACLVELGLQNAAPSEIDQVVDSAFGEIKRVRMRLDRAHADLQAAERRMLEKRASAAEIQAIKDEIARLEKQELASSTLLTTELSQIVSSRAQYKVGKEQAMEPYDRIFTALLKGWDNEKFASKVRSTEYVAGAAANSRRSSLATYCAQSLPALVDQLGANAQSFRNTRLKALQQMRSEQVRSEAAASIAAARRYFIEALAACEKLPEPERPICRARVLEHGTPQPSATPTLPTTSAARAADSAAPQSVRYEAGGATTMASPEG